MATRSSRHSGKHTSPKLCWHMSALFSLPARVSHATISSSAWTWQRESSSTIRTSSPSLLSRSAFVSCSACLPPRARRLPFRRRTSGRSGPMARGCARWAGPGISGPSSHDDPLGDRQNQPCLVSVPRVDGKWGRRGGTVISM